jgi:hypothetical protein
MDVPVLTYHGPSKPSRVATLISVRQNITRKITCIHTYVHTYIHTHMQLAAGHSVLIHTFIHTYIHTHTHMQLAAGHSALVARDLKEYVELGVRFLSVTERNPNFAHRKDRRMDSVPQFHSGERVFKA